MPTRLRALIAPALLLLALTTLTACGDDSGDKADAAGETSACRYPEDGRTPPKKVDPPPATPPADMPTSLTLSTSAGDIPITFDTTQAPCTVNSFTWLASKGWFDKTSCHRLTTAGIYVLQCGDPTGTGAGGPGYSFADELIENDPRLAPCDSSSGREVCTYGPGTVAMANAGPSTNGSQFFLVYAASPLPPNYTVFGHLDAAGLKVVKTVAAAGTADGAGDGAPKTPVEIATVE